ncbi:MAG TPA: rod shape-determining protein MreD, partial [Balneolaceae bacterium]|nr:rod shape-determining protein MreD [Balneolaceae bacterium]
MNTEFLKDLGLGFLFVLSQVVFFQHLSLFGATADPLLFFLVWIISRHERIQMLFLAAILGLIQDGFLDFWGMFMFSKTLII